MITHRKKLEGYKKLLQERYETLVKTLMGREADYERKEDRCHGAKRGTYMKEFVDQANIVDSMNLRMAVDDFSTILREIKKLAR
jgi:hypothetical protein